MFAGSLWIHLGKYGKWRQYWWNDVFLTATLSLRRFQNRVFKVVVQLCPQANAVPPAHVGLVLFQVSRRRNRGRNTWRMCRDRSHVNKRFAAGPEWIWVFGPGQLVSCAFVGEGRKTMSWHRPWDQRLSEGGGQQMATTPLPGPRRLVSCCCYEDLRW